MANVCKSEVGGRIKESLIIIRSLSWQLVPQNAGAKREVWSLQFNIIAIQWLIQWSSVKSRTSSIVSAGIHNLLLVAEMENALLITFPVMRRWKMYF